MSSKRTKATKEENSPAILMDSGFIVGLDVSTKTIGLTILDVATGVPVYMAPITFKGEKDALDKSLEVEGFLDELFIGPLIGGVKNIRAIGIENFAMKFSSGFSQISTIVTLARFNGHIERILWRLTGIKPEMLNVRSARKQVGINIVKDDPVDKKMQVVHQVKNILDEEAFQPWIMVTPKAGKNKGNLIFHESNGDMADSYVIAKALWMSYKNKNARQD